MVQIIALCVVLLRLVCASSRHSLTDDDGRITFKEAFPLPNDNEGQVLRKSAKDKCKKKFRVSKKHELPLLVKNKRVFPADVSRKTKRYFLKFSFFNDGLLLLTIFSVIFAPCNVLEI